MTEDPDTLPTHEVLHPDSIAIFTTTYYPEWYPGKLQDHREGNVDKIRGDLAIQTVMAARQKGHQLVIIDGGSSADFCQMLTDQGITPSPERERGMSASRRQGMSEATNLQGAEILCWKQILLFHKETKLLLGHILIIRSFMNRGPIAHGINY